MLMATFMERIVNGVFNLVIVVLLIDILIKVFGSWFISIIADTIDTFKDRFGKN